MYILSTSTIQIMREINTVGLANKQQIPLWLITDKKQRIHLESVNCASCITWFPIYEEEVSSKV